MEDRDLYKLFLSVADHPSQNTEDIRKVFSILVRSTLRYRDQIMQSDGTVVTIEDVRVALTGCGALPNKRAASRDKKQNQVGFTEDLAG